MVAEYVAVNIRARNIVIILLVIYFSFVTNVEYIVNFLVSFTHVVDASDIDSTTQYAEAKLFLQTVLLAVPPIILFTCLSWICFLVIRSKTMPPKDMSFPFGMNKVFGRDALFLGYVGIIVSIFQVLSKMYGVYKIYELV